MNTVLFIISILGFISSSIIYYNTTYVVKLDDGNVIVIQYKCFTCEEYNTVETVFPEIKFNKAKNCHDYFSQLQQYILSTDYIGQYRCMVNNVVKDALCVTKLNEPEFNTCVVDQIVKKGSNVTLYATKENREIRYYKRTDKSITAINGSVVELNNIQPSDAGTYIVTDGTIDLGRSINVIVFEAYPIIQTYLSKNGKIYHFYMRYFGNADPQILLDNVDITNRCLTKNGTTGGVIDCTVTGSKFDDFQVIMQVYKCNDYKGEIIIGKRIPV